jgi:hypothetical protein
MGFLTESADVGNIGLKQLREQREITTNRWEKIGLLEGLEGNVKENCAQLFENQLSHMINESSDSTNSGQFETVAFPVIRRVFAKLLANDIVSVQALNLPIGKLYYINPKASVRVDSTTAPWAEQAGGVHTSPDGAYGNAADKAANARTQFEERSLYDAFYATQYDEEGTSLFDRSKGDITVVTGSTTAQTWTNGVDKFIEVHVGGIYSTSEGKLVGPTGVPMDTESFLAGLKVVADTAFNAPSPYTEESKAAGESLPFNVKVQKYGQAIVNQDGVLKLLVDVQYAGAGGYQAMSAATSAVTFTVTYRTYSDLEEDSRMAEVTFQLDQVTVSVETRKMRAMWTPELAQDVSAFHNIDAEAELTALLSEQMAAEIDREILRDLRRGAAWTARWDYNGLRKQPTGGAYYGVQKDWNQTLVTKINQISAQIHKATLRGGASWVVVSPEVSAVFDDLEYFHVSNAAPEQDKYNMGIEKIGTLSGRYLVYRDPYAPANTVLVGHKGTSILETGYIYAPYVPMQLTPVMYNPFDFTPIRGIMTRYAKKMVLNRYYGRIYCDGLQTFGIGDLQ